MKSKAIFLDRDGTLIKDTGYLHKVEDIEFLPGVVDALKKLKAFKLFIITNQAGISKKNFLLEDMHRVNAFISKELLNHKIKIEHIYYCPHAPQDNCQCRKPKTMLIKSAQKEYDIDLKNSLVIGDKPADIMLAKNAGCKSVYLLTGHGLEYLEEARKAVPDYISAEFIRAADYVLFRNEDKIKSIKEVSEIALELRKKKKRIVTLNGTFDILHAGHDYMVSEAKKQGDILIVGVNSDSSVKSNKGKHRPINNEMSRGKMMASYKEVDYVTLFNEKTPIELLEIIKPDVHVNGSEYGENCIEAPTVKKHGGKIHIVGLLPGYSSTGILAKKG